MPRWRGVNDYAEWFAGHRRSLLRFATVLCDDADLAQDVVQEVAVRAHGRWKSLTSLDRPEAYLKRMVVNEYLSWRRKWARIVPHDDLSDLRGRNSRAVPDHADQIADRAQLRRELAVLPKQQRAVLVLRYFEGLDDAAIAELLGTAEVTVRAYASRALARLRVELTTPGASVAPSLNQAPAEGRS